MTWLNFTIFYSQEEWHLLLERCIAPLLRNEDNKYLLYLGNERGDHIRLSIYTMADRLNHVSGELTSFLAAHPSVDKEKVHPISYLFMDFPNNTVRHNLHSPASYYVEEGLQYFIAARILDEIGTDVIDEDSLFTFFTYALVMVIRVYCPDRVVAEMQLGNILGEKLQVASVFEGNEEALEYFCEEVWSDENEEVAAWALVIQSGTLEEFLPVFIHLLIMHLGLKQAPQHIQALLVAIWDVLGTMNKSAVDGRIKTPSD